ncbi:hypothetical protein PYW07_012586 [Mythimna separata]|uniref:Uncharacterized protein n=1 Tax=Mythimna separata TaxID=271217 RepID=A0AAD8DLI9_MYTSE|nr:hypothetical protein PYW07_012586 [Mythimna separata]
MPKAGFGNSNSGNTSRRFFADPDLAAEITGINKQFIIKLKVILEAMSSGHKINAEKFGEYCKDTAKMLLLTSDPYISCLRKRKPSKSQPFMSETIELFEPEELDTEVDQASKLPHSDDNESD